MATQAVRPKRITTARVLKAQHELMQALREALQSSGLPREDAEGRLSALMGDLWNEAEVFVNRLPSRAIDKGDERLWTISEIARAVGVEGEAVRRRIAALNVKDNDPERVTLVPDAEARRIIDSFVGQDG